MKQSRDRGLGKGVELDNCNSVMYNYNNMKFSLDPEASAPLYAQINDQIRYAISVGELEPNDRLPSIRQMESDLDVNRNTVRRAYIDLQNEGLITLRQGRGAVVAQSPKLPVFETARHESVVALITQLVRQAEAGGVDGRQLADLVDQAVKSHDQARPKCAYLECSAKQARDLARHAERVLERRVVPVDLHDLHDGASAIPPSVRYVFTPHWHVAEAKSILNAASFTVVPIGVKVTPACSERLGSLQGKTIGLVVRDAESVSGYRKQLRRHMRSGAIKVALADSVTDLRQLLLSVDHVVYTSPCAESIHALAPNTVNRIEIAFESNVDDLKSVRMQFFPPLPLPEKQTLWKKGDTECAAEKQAS